MTTFAHIVGARPNFIKMAPVIRALTDRANVRQRVIHTGQHYDEKMSSEILTDLALPEPDRFLGVGSGTQAEQIARALIAIEAALAEERPDLVVVAGDVNSTLAAAIVASRLAMPLAHVEAGLRSFDWSMPEEVNRVLTDRLSDLLFTHSPEAADNLRREGIIESKVHYVGNTMIDSLRRFEGEARARAAWRDLDLHLGEYVLVTLHRPSNVDWDHQLEGIVAALIALARRAPVVFPIHPRTRARLESIHRLQPLLAGGVRCTGPTGYIDFLSYELGAGAILTDSGGVQEEAAAFSIPCYTLRPNTERPVTLSHGTNRLLGEDPRAITEIRLSPPGPVRKAIPLWDGRAGERVADVLEQVSRTRAKEARA